MKPPPVYLAMLYLGSGERERALSSLGEACGSHRGWRAPYLAVDPVFDPLRSEPLLVCATRKATASGNSSAEIPAPG